MIIEHNSFSVPFMLILTVFKITFAKYLRLRFLVKLHNSFTDFNCSKSNHNDMRIRGIF